MQERKCYYKQHGCQKVVNPWIHYKLREIETQMWTLAQSHDDLIETYKDKINHEKWDRKK